MTESTAETLAGLERERVQTMEELAEVAKVQKGLQSRMRAAEKRHRETLKGVEEVAQIIDREERA